MSPSPVLADSQRVPTEIRALTTASAATRPATLRTTAVSCFRMPLSMIVLSSSGTATVITADTAVAARNSARVHR
jgi:hypothetical protein